MTATAFPPRVASSPGLPLTDRGRSSSRAGLPSATRSSVGELRAAASSRDLRRLRAVLDPEVSVVVDSGEPDHAKVRVVHGVEDASLLLAHGLGARRGLEVTERPVNGSPGLLLSRDGRRTASIAVDLAGRLVRVVWVRLDPVALRRGNAV